MRLGDWNSEVLRAPPFLTCDVTNTCDPVSVNEGIIQVEEFRKKRLHFFRHVYKLALAVNIAHYTCYSKVTLASYLQPKCYRQPTVNFFGGSDL